MFDRIAKRYDLLNRLISLGRDEAWRKKLIDNLLPDGAADDDEILDVATGTADVALAIARRFKHANIVGLDPSAKMLEIGQQKVDTSEVAERITLVLGDAQQLPFEDERFAASCISFGIRNVPDRTLGLAEMSRVTRRGGVVAVLELCQPRKGLLSSLARFYVHGVMPRLARLIAKDGDSYEYLAQSIAAFPPPEEFSTMLAGVGLTPRAPIALNLGTVYLYIGRKN